jgi:hypothetical protein
MLIHSLDVQWQHLLVTPPLGVFLQLDQPLHVIQGFPFAGVLNDFASEVFEVAAKQTHVIDIIRRQRLNAMRPWVRI